MNIYKEYIEINGIRQNIMTMKTDSDNPVLLIVHGGAGLPDRPLIQQYSSELAEYYTVVCWDQRGSGLSYTRGKLTVEIMLNDLKALIEYLRKEYNQEKIYLAGHSWGAYLGAIFTHRYPEYVKYYIGTGQKVTLKATESDKYNFVKNQSLKQNNLKLLQKLECFGEPQGNTYKISNAKAKVFVRSGFVRYASYFSKNTDKTMINYLAEYLRLYSKYYRSDLGKFILGAIKSLAFLNIEMESTDTISPITELKVPVLLISGEEDMVCPTPLAKRWYDNLTAPKKDFFIIENASHMVNFEKPQIWNELVKNLLAENN